MGFPAYSVTNKAASALSVTVWPPEEDPVYPFANSRDGILANPFRATNPEDLRIDYELGVSVNFVAILNHNFSGSQTAMLESAPGVYPAAGTLIDYFPVTTKDLLLTFPAQSPAFLRLTINDPGHVENLQIGEIVIGHYITLPRAERYGATIGRRDEDRVLETERGVEWIYKQFTKRVRKMKFRVPESDLSVFEDLHIAAQGQRVPFVFIPDVDKSDVWYARKDKDFMPQELDEPGVVDGTETAIYDYELELRELVRGTDVLA